MTSKPKAKPCVTCNGKRTRVIEAREGLWTGLKVECIKCGRGTRIYAFRDFAIQMWNKFHNVKEN